MTAAISAVGAVRAHGEVRVTPSAHEDPAVLASQHLEHLLHGHEAQRDHDVAEAELEVETLQTLLLQKRRLELLRIDTTGLQGLPSEGSLGPDELPGVQEHLPQLLSADLEDLEELVLGEVSTLQQDLADLAALCRVDGALVGQAFLEMFLLEVPAENRQPSEKMFIESGH